MYHGVCVVSKDKQGGEYQGLKVAWIMKLEDFFTVIY